MKKTLHVINDLEKEGIIAGYAIGGATALLFYAEPTLTFDVDIFIFLPNDKDAESLNKRYSLRSSPGQALDPNPRQAAGNLPTSTEGALRGRLQPASPVEGATRAPVIDLSPLYNALKSRKYRAEKEHVIIEGIPIQFIPVYNALVEEAVREAGVKSYQGIKTKVLKIEYLLAIMIDTNRPKDRERIKNLVGVIKFDKKLLRSVLERHSLSKRWEKEIEKK